MIHLRNIFRTQQVHAGMWVRFAFLAAYGVVMCIAAPAHAGGIAGAIERNIAKRLSQRGETAVLSATERAFLAKAWRDLDRKSLAAIERRYGAYINSERMGQAVRTPASVMDRATFDQHLREMDPGMSQTERESILGYYFDRRLVINGNQIQVPLTVAHERLHQLSHARFKETFGTRLNEGVTEIFARGIYSDLALVDKSQVYPSEQRIATMLGARIGEQRLARAYFNGEISAVRDSLESDLGSGSFKRFSEAMRSSDVATAEAILR